MDPIGHDRPRVQLVAPDFRSVLDRSRDELRNGRLSEKGGAAASVIEPAVHGDEGFAGRLSCQRKVMNRGWPTTSSTPRFSRVGERPERPPQAGGLPHKQRRGLF